LAPEEPTNSNLLIERKGLGKTSLLYWILVNSNPKYVFALPDKLYESLIVEMPLEYFDKKVWVLDDLVTSFGGLTTKQREQLMSFFNSILSKKCYEREGKRRVENAQISCQFGFALENYETYANRMLLSTFLDRIVPIKLEHDPETIKNICKRIVEEKDRKLPKVSLPFTKKPVEVDIPIKFNDEIVDCAMRLQASQSLSGTRAVNYVKNFIRAHAFLNKRKEVCEADVNILKLILPLHIGMNSGDLETKIRELILAKTSRGETVTGREIKEVFGKQFNKTAISETLSKLRRDIPNRKISLSKGGYDYEFFI
jgi:hypothetical protein